MWNPFSSKRINDLENELADLKHRAATTDAAFQTLTTLIAIAVRELNEDSKKAILAECKLYLGSGTNPLDLPMEEHFVQLYRNTFSRILDTLVTVAERKGPQYDE
jgi:hypothetical protein